MKELKTLLNEFETAVKRLTRCEETGNSADYQRQQVSEARGEIEYLFDWNGSSATEVISRLEYQLAESCKTVSKLTERNQYAEYSSAKADAEEIKQLRARVAELEERLSKTRQRELALVRAVYLAMPKCNYYENRKFHCSKIAKYYNVDYESTEYMCEDHREAFTPSEFPVRELENYQEIMSIVGEYQDELLAMREEEK